MATMSLHYTFSSRLLSLTTMIGAQVYRNGWKFLKLSKRRSLQSLCRHEAHCSISHFDNVSTTRFGSFVPPQLNASKKRWFSSCPQDHVHEDHAHIMEALKDAPGVQAGEGEKFVMVYTCTVCSTRSAKTISKHAYQCGVVLVRCPGCENLHLVADRLGWFDEESVDIEKIMKEKGETVQVFTQENVLELTNNHVTTGITPATCTPITITDG